MSNAESDNYAEVPLLSGLFLEARRSGVTWTVDLVRYGRSGGDVRLGRVRADTSEAAMLKGLKQAEKWIAQPIAEALRKAQP